MQSATTSPFACISDDPWILWEKKERLDFLREENENRQDEIAVQLDSTFDALDNVMPASQVQRTQYHSVLNRMKQACRNTGSFSNWKS